MNLSITGGWILVVDDDAAAREMILTVLAGAGFEVRAAGSVGEALELMNEEPPALVFTDIVLPGQSGYELCRMLRERFGETLPIIFLSGIRTEEFDVIGGLLIGADDYVTKPFLPGEIIARARRALARSSAVPSQDLGVQLHSLTAREREVLGLLADGLSQEQIAARLVISSTTVATHIQRILGKLDLHSRAEAVAWAYRTRLFAEGVTNGAARDRAGVGNGNP